MNYNVSQKESKGKFMDLASRLLLLLEVSELGSFAKVSEHRTLITIFIITSWTGKKGG